ncbi:MAG: hypothetical protein JXA44_13940 [Methanospirillaceae archaeon]|nr:hypothetical protein [Methanospirillaceae archaeon]
MKFLIFDTETIGLPRIEITPFQYPEYWPHLIQLAWIVAQEKGSLQPEFPYYTGKVYHPTISNCHP